LQPKAGAFGESSASLPLPDRAILPFVRDGALSLQGVAIREVPGGGPQGFQRWVKPSSFPL